MIRADVYRERILRRVVHAPCPKPGLGDCWIWQGAKKKGARPYGYIKHEGSPRLVHRIAHALWNGAVPTDREIDHLCNVPACCNPRHLEAVTHVVNVRRGRSATKTHCVNGHEFTASNTLYEAGRLRDGTPTKYRRCRVCTDAKLRRFHAKGIAA